MAVMSFHTWQAKYGSDLSVVGSTYHINGHPFTMIGIAAPAFFGAEVGRRGHARLLAAANYRAADRGCKCASQRS